MKKVHFKDGEQTRDNSSANQNVVEHPSLAQLTPPSLQFKRNDEGLQEEESIESEKIQLKSKEMANDGNPGEEGNGDDQPIQRNTDPGTDGLPENLQSGVESLSGISMDDVNVHYNSSEPAQLNAHAYAQGTDIHIGPGQEKHLPHEAWHVVQQKQGRVEPTIMQKNKVPVNDDSGLEKEADVMGAKAKQMGNSSDSSDKAIQRKSISQGVVQKNGDPPNMEDAWNDRLAVRLDKDARKNDIVHASESEKVQDMIETTNNYLDKSDNKQALRNYYGVKKLKKIVEKFHLLKYYIQELDYLLRTNQQMRPYAYGQTMVQNRGQLRASIKKTASKINGFTLANDNLNDRQSLEADIHEINLKLAEIGRARSDKKKAKDQNKAVTDQAVKDLKKEKSDHPESDQKKKDYHKAKSIKHSTRYIDLSTASVANLSSIIKPILGGDVGSLALSFSVGVSQGLGGALKVGGGLTFEQTLWVEDDKRIRMKKGLHLSGYADAGMQDVLGLKGSAGAGLIRTQVFNSPEQWAAYTGQKCLLSFLNGVRKHKKRAQKHAEKADSGLSDEKINDFSFLEEWGVNYPFISEILRYSQQDVMKVTGGTFNLNAEFSAFGILGFNASATETVLDFRKKSRGPDGRKNVVDFQQTANIFSINVGFNIGSYFDAQLTYTKIVNHANSDNDGSYISLKISTKAAKLEYGFANPNIQDACHSALEDFRPFDGNENLVAMDEESGEEVLKPLIQQIKQAFNFEQLFSHIAEVDFPVDFKIGKKTTPSLEGVYMYSKGGYRNLYVRKALDVTLSADATIYTGGPVNVDLGFSAGRSKGEDVSVGTDSIAYFLTVYNGYNKRKVSRDHGTGKDTKNEWIDFVERWHRSFEDLFNKLENIDNYKKLKLELIANFADSEINLGGQEQNDQNPRIPGALEQHIYNISNAGSFEAKLSRLEAMFDHLNRL